MTKNQMGVLIEDLYDRVEILSKDRNISASERKKQIESIIENFVHKYSGKVDGMNDRQLGEYVKIVLERTKKEKNELKKGNKDWR